MDIQTLTSFFGWCTIINVCMFLLWTVFFVFTPNFTYRMQSRWFPMSRETYDVVVYCFLGAYKIIIGIFNLVPYIALRVVA